MLHFKKIIFKSKTFKASSLEAKVKPIQIATSYFSCKRHNFKIVLLFLEVQDTFLKTMNIVLV